MAVEAASRRAPSGLGLRRLGADVGATLTRQVAAVGLGLGLSMLLARILGPGGNGRYAVAILLPTTLATMLQLGLGAATVYFVGRGEFSVRDTRRAVLWLWSGLSITGIAIAAVIVGFWGDRFEGIGPAVLWGAIGLFPLILLQALLTALLQARQDFRRYNIVSLVRPAVVLPAAAATVWLLGGGVAGAMVAFGIGHLCALLVTWRSVAAHVEADGPRRSAAEFVRHGLPYGWRSHLSNVLSFLNYRADIFLITLLVGPAATGVYVIAVGLAEKLWMLSAAVSTVLFPRLSALHGDEAARKELTPLVARMVLIATAGGAAVLAVASGPLIALLFGPEYAGARSALLLLLPGVVLLAVSRVLANDIAARGRPQINMWTALVVATINIVANVALLPILGILGAAIATTTSYGIGTLMKLFFYARLSGNTWRQTVVVGRRDWELCRIAAARLHALR